MVDKFHDYLYGSKFEAIADNNPLTYNLTTAKLDAARQRWVASLSNYNFCIKYRSGRSNADADGLSGKAETHQEEIIFPEVLQAICQSTVVNYEQCPFVESLALTCNLSDTDTVPEQLLDDHALTAKDWRKAQRNDPTLKYIIDHKQTGSRVTAPQTQTSSTIDRRYFKNSDKFVMLQDVLYRKVILNGQEFQQLVLPMAFKDIHALHDDLGHQGRDHTTSLVKQRFFWPGMDADIQARVRQCERCILRKTRQVGWLVVFGLNDPLRQYFSLYRVVSQREGEREEKG